MTKFNEQLKEANKWENAVGAYYTNTSNTVTGYTTNNTTDYQELKKWDVELGRANRRPKTVEVKYDHQTKSTGNLFIEVKYKGYPSGISATTSNGFMYIVPDANTYVFKSDTLRQLISDHKPYYIDYAGDDGNSEGYLISTELASLSATTIPTEIIKRFKIG